MPKLDFSKSTFVNHPDSGVWGKIHKEWNQSIYASVSSGKLRRPHLMLHQLLPPGLRERIVSKKGKQQPDDLSRPTDPQRELVMAVDR